MAREGVIALRRIGLVTADLASAERFYRECLGFERLTETTRDDVAFAELLATPPVRSRSVLLRLGREELELVSYEPQGHDYPQRRAANDGWFQHMAIVVADMPAAYDILVRGGKMVAISTRGPEQLPPSTGPVTAFKFRDPEGHPIELSAFPPGVGAARWHEQEARGNCLGIDHSAISVADVDRSIDFYCGVLGMRLASRSVNRGIEQERLDGLASESVDIVTLQPTCETSPHIELLAYHPLGRTVPLPGVTDIAATRLTLEVADLRRVLSRLPSSQALMAQNASARQPNRDAALVRDPDGHLLWLSE